MFTPEEKLLIEAEVDTWGQETILLMRERFTEKISNGSSRSYDKTNTRVYKNKKNWTPRVNTSEELINWMMVQPSYVDDDYPPGQMPNYYDILDWSMDRKIPNQIFRSKFVFLVQKLVFQRGVKGIRYSNIFDSPQRVASLENDLYTTIGIILERKLQNWEKNQI